MFNANGTPLAQIWVGNQQRELRQYQGYWYIQLTARELAEWPGCHWTGYVLIHKFKWWKKYGEWFSREEATYHYADRDPNNIRITNIVVLPRCQ